VRRILNYYVLNINLFLNFPLELFSGLLAYYDLFKPVISSSHMFESMLDLLNNQINY